MVHQVGHSLPPSSRLFADRRKRSAGLSDGQIMVLSVVVVLGLGAAAELIHYLLLNA